MQLIAKHYNEPDAETALLQVLTKVISEAHIEPVFLCIGSDRHILDCFGPLTGSMILEQVPEARIFGSLRHPLHARNLNQRLFEIRREYPGGYEIAIDASLGRIEEMGMIKLREGPLHPGLAVARQLPSAGRLSITAVVGTTRDKRKITQQYGSIEPVYYLACLLSSVIVSWYRQRGVFDADNPKILDYREP
ncbi:spore protease YyaC [Syntrophomonas palmitatica]|uniref:spore protease YyaC n=1 Tax=Syntrophomonas palmitatica TaxID=402877 RepID=UPI000A73B555|nr:spore protease YyaC [Syntrophomonas palmitatica]